MKAQFQLDRISSGYDEKIVLQDISFEIKEGEFLGIIGPNGSGKTTLLRTLTRILRPISGKITYKGEELSRLSLKQLAKDIAFVPQETFSAFSFTVLDIVMMGRYPHLGRFELESKRDYDIAKKALETVGCLELVNEDLDKISAGERQRAIIAKALAQEPGMLMLDEPTSRLDIGHQIEIFDIIKRLNIDKRITVITVLHDLNLAGDYCDRLVLMDRGRVFKIGSVGEILTYQNIEKVYNTTVVVDKSPATKNPHVVLTPKYKK
jgi:iron complex transport system ATP-binding protein